MTEKKLEDQIEKALEAHGYTHSPAANFDKTYALDLPQFWQFLEQSQPEEIEKLKRFPDWKARILGRYDKLVRKKGALELFRKGLKVDDAHLMLLFPLPTQVSGQLAAQNFRHNRFSFMRQVHYDAQRPALSLDMVLFLNGMPLCTLELKNPITGQNAEFHGQEQYKRDRDPKQTLLNFARTLVHFTADTEEVFMTTKLQGKDTFFLPFNKGNLRGKGNPTNPHGHKTAYLWEETFAPKSWADLIENYLLLTGEKKLQNHTLFFPRYHQWEVVRKLAEHTRSHGVGQTYLIQHSAGSGKSNSITWAAFRLIATYPERKDLPGARGLDVPLFDTVIVVTDRRLLDKQLRNNIRSFQQQKNIVAAAQKSQDLRKHLEEGKKIITTTVQKFPFIVDEIGDLSQNRFAILIDEAHSSQSGITAAQMNRALGADPEDDDEGDIAQRILKQLRERKMRPNASYFAFTATPKNSTLERFGEELPDGSFQPFHLYSMRQAIQEGFILDVLSNYTTYKSYYELQKKLEEQDPDVDKNKGKRELRSMVERDPRTIHIKAEIIVNHFLEQVVRKGRYKLNGLGLGMVLTENITMAVSYFRAIKKILKAKGEPFKVLVAFSGTKQIDGEELSEAKLNGFPEGETAERFDNPRQNYRLLVVANKYLTGFDQPKLCAMYVDKKLQGVLAVQALSRLNRAAQKIGKRTQDLSVLDFHNAEHEIKEAFQPYYGETRLLQPSDPNLLHDLKDELDDTGVYEQEEYLQFTEGFFGNKQDHEITPLLDRAAQRFNHDLDLEPQDKKDFKVKAKHFVKVYAQLAGIMPYENLGWEYLFWFLRFLIPKLDVGTHTPEEDLSELREFVRLETYGLARTKLNYKISLEDKAGELEPQNPTPRSAHQAHEERDPLSQIILDFNERFFGDWEQAGEDRKEFYFGIARAVAENPDVKKAYDQPDPQARQEILNQAAEKITRKKRREDAAFFKRLQSDPDFKDEFLRMIANIVNNSLAG